VVDLNHSHKTFNIRQLIPFKPCQNHWGRNMSYHMPHQIQVNTQSSGLLPCMLSLFKNPLTFFTNTCHPFTTLPSVLFYKERLYIFMQHSSKHWRGSPFTSLPHHHLVRVEVNTFILILIVSILL
jgi:hypothetical protein